MFGLFKKKPAENPALSDQAKFLIESFQIQEWSVQSSWGTEAMAKFGNYWVKVWYSRTNDKSEVTAATIDREYFDRVLALTIPLSPHDKRVMFGPFIEMLRELQSQYEEKQNSLALEMLGATHPTSDETER